MAREEKKETVRKNTTKGGSNSRRSSNTSKTRERVNKSSRSTKEVEQLRIEEVVDEEVQEDVVTNTDNKKKIKTGDILLVLGLVAVVIIGLFAMKGEKVKPSYKLPLELSGDAGLALLSYADYEKKINNNEAFVVVLSRETCSHCANFMPVAKQFAEDKKVPMYYVDTDTFTEDDWNSFEESITFLKEKNGNWGTPTTLVQAGSETVDYIEGETTAESLDELYNKYFKFE